MSDMGPRAPASPAPPPEGAARTTGEAGSSSVVLQAFELHKRFVEGRGAEVVGLAGSVRDALDLVEAKGDRLDGAVLDINLRGERVYPVADALAARGVPFVFLTGYDARVIPDAYAGVPRCEKPVSSAVLSRMLSKVGVR